MAITDRLFEKSSNTEENREKMKRYYKEIDQTSGSKRDYMLKDMAHIIKDRPDLYDYIPESVINDHRPENAFFQETIKTNPLAEQEERLKKTSTYTKTDLGLKNLIRDIDAFKKGSKEITEKRANIESEKRRIKSKEEADLLRPEYKKEMTNLNEKWINLKKKGLLTDVMNMALSSKMMELIKKVPDLYEQIPKDIKNSPGLPEAQPFYKEARYHINNDGQIFKDILKGKDDPRKNQVAKLISDTARDEKLQKDPEKAKAYHDILSGKKREQPKKAYIKKSSKDFNNHLNNARSTTFKQKSTFNKINNGDKNFDGFSR